MMTSVVVLGPAVKVSFAAVKRQTEKGKDDKNSELSFAAVKLNCCKVLM